MGEKNKIIGFNQSKFWRSHTHTHAQIHTPAAYTQLQKGEYWRERGKKKKKFIKIHY
jgi:hypothetical protein